MPRPVFDRKHAPAITAAVSSFIARHDSQDAERRRPFVTIAREAGAGGHSLAVKLAERLNKDNPSQPWRCFDRELIEKVADDHDLAREMVARLPDEPHNWFQDFAEGWKTSGDRPSDEFIYQKMIATIRTIAEMGHSILVGRGANLCTRGIPGGVHIHLYAPLAHRIEFAQESLEMTREEAVEWIARTDRRREAFLDKFWPSVENRTHHYTIMLNSAHVDLEAQVTIVSLLINEAKAALNKSAKS